jgi:hypothetical protein
MLKRTELRAATHTRARRVVQCGVVGNLGMIAYTQTQRLRRATYSRAQCADNLGYGNVAHSHSRNGHKAHNRVLWHKMEMQHKIHPGCMAGNHPALVYAAKKRYSTSPETPHFMRCMHPNVKASTCEQSYRPLTHMPVAVAAARVLSSE